MRKPRAEHLQYVNLDLIASLFLRMLGKTALLIRGPNRHFKGFMGEHFFVNFCTSFIKKEEFQQYYIFGEH